MVDIEWMSPNEQARDIVTRAQEHAKRGDDEGAWRLLKEAVETYPEVPDVHLHMALFMAWIDDAAEGLKIITALRQRVPNRPVVWAAEQSIAAHAGDFLRVLAIHDRMLKTLHPLHQYVIASYVQLGMMQVKRGMWKDGFANSECEFLAGRRTLRAVKRCPPWTGEADPSGVLFIYFDQGLGDTIMYARFLADAKRRWGGKLVLDVQPELKRWAERWAGPDEVIASGDVTFVPENATRKLAITGLPFACGIETDEQVSRGAVLCDVPAAEDVPHDAVNIGICWRGSDAFAMNGRRSVPFEQFRQLLGVDGARYWSFQFGVYERECDDPAVVRVSERAHDFWDTCRYLKAMDLTISVDTSVINAAGAAGANAWVLAWNPVEIRWGMPHEERGKWYPQIRPYWREPHSAWSHTLRRVRNDLAEFVKHRTSCVTT